MERSDTTIETVLEHDQMLNGAIRMRPVGLSGVGGSHSLSLYTQNLARILSAGRGTLLQGDHNLSRHIISLCPCSLCSLSVCLCVSSE